MMLGKSHRPTIKSGTFFLRVTGDRHPSERADRPHKSREKRHVTNRIANGAGVDFGVGVNTNRRFAVPTDALPYQLFLYAGYCYFLKRAIGVAWESTNEPMCV